MRNQGEVSHALITIAMEQTLDCLRQHYRVTEEGAGWYHYLDDPSPGISASSVGLFVFQTTGRVFEHTDRVVRYLLDHQVQGHGDYDGGWSVRTTRGFPVVEATGWVLRALSGPECRMIGAQDALSRGVAWLCRNQNTDFGWGSYRGRPSRVFTTSLAMLALQECGGDVKVVDNAQKWLIDAQSPQSPAWGPTPGAEPTSLHTSIALLALLNQRGALGTNAVSQTCEWLLEHLTPGEHSELRTTVEDYDVPYEWDGIADVFQNSMPHFAGPMALTAMLAAGASPLSQEIFGAIRQIIDSQLEQGHWELPRSPTRPSIWAIHPFVQALAAARDAVVPTPGSEAILLYSGCAIVQSTALHGRLTRNLLLRNVFFDWLRRRKVTVCLWVLAVCYILVAWFLLATGSIAPMDFVISLILPVVVMIFHLLWERQSKSREDRAP